MWELAELRSGSFCLMRKSRRQFCSVKHPEHRLISRITTFQAPFLPVSKVKVESRGRGSLSAGRRCVWGRERWGGRILPIPLAQSAALKAPPSPTEPIFPIGTIFTVKTLLTAEQGGESQIPEYCVRGMIPRSSRNSSWLHFLIKMQWIKKGGDLVFPLQW